MSFEVPLDVETNPMFVSSVLEATFGMLSAEDLKNCRFVCSIWKTEAFRALRKRTCVNLNTKSKVGRFLSFNQCSIFTKFHFKTCDWTPSISTYMLGVQPSQLEVKVTLTVNPDQVECGSSERFLEDLLVKQSRTISRLEIKIDWKVKKDELDLTSSDEWTIAENLLCLRFPQLREFVILRSNPHINSEVIWLHPLWISIVSNSPKLTRLRLKNINQESFWKGVSATVSFSQLKELAYVHDSTSLVFEMYQHLLQNPLPRVCLQRLCVAFHAHGASVNQTLLEQILEQVAGTLEILEFYTNDQTALSPIRFPVMPNLRILDSGSSQFSFPSISPANLPKLSEIRATYWDWVYSIENLPDTRYYWRTNDPHSLVTDIQLRFPNWFDVAIDYTRLEIFHEFADVLNSKFPNACNLTIHNVPVCDDVRRGLETLFNVFELSIRTFKIASYCPSDVMDPSPFELTVVDEAPHQQRVLEVLDLSTSGWPAIWRRQPTMLSNIRDEWLSGLGHFGNLRVLKILWARNLFTLLQLTNKDILPNLEHLEFVGGLCIDRFERAKVKRLRPLLRLIQHKNCFCPEEDWWYMHDPESDKIFKNLFSTHLKFPLSVMLRKHIPFCLLGQE
ncbi:unnamed protein product [Orchesella dallaii]|uniref:F-box domain-containing protein n=1 Tax=Orchesella dallaii TaxID=48710 RepID=A0ABP1QXB8_9HEXA